MPSPRFTTKSAEAKNDAYERSPVTKGRCQVVDQASVRKIEARPRSFFGVAAHGMELMHSIALLIDSVRVVQHC